MSKTIGGLFFGSTTAPLSFGSLRFASAALEGTREVGVRRFEGRHGGVYIVAREKKLRRDAERCYCFPHWRGERHDEATVRKDLRRVKAHGREHDKDASEGVRGMSTRIETYSSLAQDACETSQIFRPDVRRILGV